MSMIYEIPRKSSVITNWPDEPNYADWAEFVRNDSVTALDNVLGIALAAIVFWAAIIWLLV